MELSRSPISHGGHYISLHDHIEDNMPIYSSPRLEHRYQSDRNDALFFTSKSFHNINLLESKDKSQASSLPSDFRTSTLLSGSPRQQIDSSPSRLQARINIPSKQNAHHLNALNIDRDQKSLESLSLKSDRLESVSSTPQTERRIDDVVAQRLRKKDPKQLISDFKNSLVNYSTAIERALGAAQLGTKVNSSIILKPDLTSQQLEFRDMLFETFEVVTQKLRQLDEEVLSLRSHIQKMESKESSPLESPFTIDDDIEHIDDLLSDCINAYEEKNRQLDVIEMRLKYMSIRSSDTEIDEIEKLKVNQNILELASDADLESLKSIVAPTENVTMIFVDIKGSTGLWESCGNDMFESILLYHYLTRRLQQKYSLYECKSNGDGFFLVTGDARNAILFCLELQLQLLSMSWPKTLLNSDGGRPVYSENGKLLFSGLTVRCGCHFSPKPLTMIDQVTGRRDYMGTDVNKAARLETVALDGEIAISDTLYQILERDLKQQKLPMKVKVADRGMRKLKGIETDERVRGIVPESLEARFSFNDSKEALGVPSEDPFTIDVLIQEKRRLQEELDALQNETIDQIQMATQKKKKAIEKKFIINLKQLTKDSKAVSVEEVLSCIQKYQEEIQSQESKFENYCSRVKNIAEDGLEKSLDSTLRKKKLRKKKFKKTPSFSQLTADIHKSTVSSGVKAKTDRSLVEIEELKNQLQHAKNEVAMLRRTIKNQKKELTPSPTNQGINIPSSSNSGMLTPSGHSPNSTYGPSLATSPLTSPVTPYTSSSIFPSMSPRIPARFDNQLKARSKPSDNDFDLPVALHPDPGGFGVRQTRGRSQSVLHSPLPKDSRNPFGASLGF